MLRHLPNLLSVIRLALGVAFPFVPMDWQVWVIAVAALTDTADGRLARGLGAASPVGKYLDPAADKVFVAAVLATLVVRGPLLPADLAVLVVRDVVVLLGTAGLLAAGRRDVLARLGPSPLGKATTVAQLLYLLVVVWARDRFPAGLAVAGSLGALAALDYLRRGRRALTRPAAVAAELS